MLDDPLRPDDDPSDVALREQNERPDRATPTANLIVGTAAALLAVALAVIIAVS